MKVNGRHYRTVWMNPDDPTVYLIEQNLLPFEFKIHKAGFVDDTCSAIRTMIVRGAGAIGATAGFAMAQAFLEAPNDKHFLPYIDRCKTDIEQTRPTAQNLFYATNRVYNAAISSPNPTEAVEIAIKEAQAIADKDAEQCRKIGEHGSTLIGEKCTIQTHCNAGWLAFVDYGSALSPVYVAYREGKNISVYVDETRPRSQGSRLTAWELTNEGVPHAIIADNAGAHLMSQGKINMIIVGSDRIARNGDVANKIGTLEKAIVAKEFGVPFYVAAPSSTIDPDCSSGREIPIENRDEEEVLYQTGLNAEGEITKILVASPKSRAINPAFDVTPNSFITGIITEKGIFEASEKGIEQALA